MDKINWSLFEPLDFQRFCNALLSFEISKNVIPFNAPGRDDGYDGLFEGSYDGKSGLWRFQYKYHNTTRSKDFSSLKKELPNEINKVTDEDNLILITNVELLPRERKELLALAQEQIALHHKGNIYFDIWDGGKIFNLSMHFPIIRQWLEERGSSQLLDYYKFWRGIDKAHELFIGREEDQNKFQEFINSDALILVISGEAGIGKTSLCTNFFDNVLKENNNWAVIFLASHSINFDSIANGLLSDTNFIIFIDDAHRYNNSAAIVADFFRIATISRQNKIKIVVTARGLFFKDSLRLVRKEIKEGELQSIDLHALSIERTKDIFNEVLLSGPYAIYIDELSMISRGKPILINAIIKAVGERKNIYDIRKDDFFNNYVDEYFNEFISKFSNENSIENYKLLSLLQVLCLIEPVPYNDSNLINFLAIQEGLLPHIVEGFLNELKKYNYSVGDFELMIKPDYYSDILLYKANHTWLNTKIESYSNYINNIIKNLAEIDETKSTPNQNSLLDKLLDGYLSKISVAHDVFLLDKILQTVEFITYSKPLFAINSIEKIIENGSNSEHWLYNTFKEISSQKRKSDWGFMQTVREILSILSSIKLYNRKCLELVLKLYDLTNDGALFSSVIAFSRQDHLDHYKCVKQQYFVGETCSLMSDENQSLLAFIMEGYKSLLKLSFTGTRSNIENRFQITMITYYIPENENIVRLRKTIIENLEAFFIRSKSKPNKHSALNLLLDIPREIRSSTRNKVIYQGDKEIEEILVFIDNQTKNGIELEFRQIIQEKLYWYVRWGDFEKYNTILSRISNNLKPENLSEKLINLFTKTLEDIDLNFGEIDSLFKSRSNEIIHQETDEAISLALLEIYNEYIHMLPHYYSQFLETIFDFPERTAIIFEMIYEKDKRFVFQFGCVFLNVLYFRYKNEAFFRTYVWKIFEIGTIEAFNCLLFIYIHKLSNSQKDILNKNDEELLLKIYDSKFVENNHYLGQALLPLLVTNKEAGLEKLKLFLHDCNQKQAESLIFSFLNYYPEYFEELKEIVLFHTIRFNISYQMEEALKRIVDKEWEQERFSLLFDYLIRRYQFKEESIENSEANFYYDWVPHNDGSRILENRTEIEKIEIFKISLNWYIEHVDKYYGLFTSKILEYFQPATYLTEDLFVIYNEILKRSNLEQNQLKNLAKSLNIFRGKNELLMIIVSTIIERAEKDIKDTEILSDINFAIYDAIGPNMSKSGIAGQPFQVDLDLRIFLLKQIELNEEGSTISRLLQDALKNVNREIEDQENRNTQQW